MSEQAAAPISDGVDFLIEQIVNSADLSTLTPDTRVKYYKAVCERVGLDPLSKPFEFYSLSGKTVLYAKRECTDQLRKLHKIDIKIADRSVIEGVFVVTARAVLGTGRTDESTGAVSLKFPKLYKNRKGELIPHPKAGQDIDGEDKANAMMKAETKAKRRVTLSIVGLGILDESEILDIEISGSGNMDNTPVALPGPVAKDTPAQPAAPVATTPAAAATSQQPPATSEATAPASTASPAAAAPAQPATDATKDLPTKDVKADETGELMPANRIKVFEAKMKAGNIDEAKFVAKFGKPLKDMLKSQSAEIQAFLDGK